MTQSRLTITADDYGYAPAYDRGILEAANAGAIDAASVMVLRAPDPMPLRRTGIAIGLHLELPLDGTHATKQMCDQLQHFEALFESEPDYVDGHRHCHAAPGIAARIASEAAARNLPLRSVSAEHRAQLRSVGVSTSDRLIGRTAETEPPLPELIKAWIRGLAPPGVTEWFTHPGYPDASTGSRFDRGRAEDLRLLLYLASEPELLSARRLVTSAAD